MVHGQSASVGNEPMIEGQPAQAKQSLFEKFAVPIVFVIFVTFRAIDRVFLKALNNALARSSYNLIWGNLMWPIAIQIMTIVMILGYIGLMRLQGDKTYNLKFFLPGSPLASAAGPVPLYQLALFSLGDQLNAAISSAPSAFVSQPIQSVMTNAVLIWMAIIAFFWLGTRYKWNHFLGIVLVMASCAVPFVPTILHNDCSEPIGKDCFSAYHSPLGGGDGKYLLLSASAMLAWYSLFFVSTMPMAVGNVYKQKVLQGKDVDVFYATWWSGNFQVVWGLLCLPLLWVPLPEQEHLGPAEFFPEIANTFACIGGHVAQEGDETCATSPPPWVWICLYLSFNISFNMCMTWLVKRISANWAQVATVVCLALCNVFSTLKFVMHSSAETMGGYDWGGVLLACLSLVVYNLAPEIQPGGKDNPVQGMGSFVSDGHANVAEKVHGASKDNRGIGQTGSFKG